MKQGIKWTGSRHSCNRAASAIEDSQFASSVYLDTKRIYSTCSICDTHLINCSCRQCGPVAIILKSSTRNICIRESSKPLQVIFSGYRTELEFISKATVCRMSIIEDQRRCNITDRNGIELYARQATGVSGGNSGPVSTTLAIISSHLPLPTGKD